ncbi:hypothetical protein BDQ12DRAFT_717437 [Crucibulum laeve]|uniref:Uncharacterized protein n=1 Tax=Crucibulum laeve TaxID=68775 RepID=A0A5C3MFX0_9AGAR|nr:hypothetical protein BDQ12DRAFT_717437 [Crucibulum laeve]
MAMTESERQRYSEQLAAYTLRQFATARAHLDQPKKAYIAAKLPAIQARIARYTEKAADCEGVTGVQGMLHSVAAELPDFGISYSLSLY